MSLPLKKAVQEIEIESAIDLLAGVCDELIKKYEPKQGPPGPPGAEGKPGAPGKDSTVPGPKGDPGRDGVDGKSITGPPGRDGIDGKSIIGPPGRDGRDGVDGKSIVGPVGPAGPQGEPGKPEVTLEEVETLVLNIIGKSASEHLQQLVALKREIGLIETDKRYHRVHSLREEICERLKRHL